MSDVRWIFKKYMDAKRIEDFKALAKLTGIKYQTLLDHIDDPRLFRAFELRELNNVLQFSSEDLLQIIE